MVQRTRKGLKRQGKMEGQTLAEWSTWGGLRIHHTPQGALIQSLMRHEDLAEDIPVRTAERTQHLLTENVRNSENEKHQRRCSISQRDSGKPSASS